MISSGPLFTAFSAHDCRQFHFLDLGENMPFLAEAHWKEIRDNGMDAYSRWWRRLATQALQGSTRDAERPQGASEGHSERLKAPALS